MLDRHSGKEENASIVVVSLGDLHFTIVLYIVLYVVLGYRQWIE